MTPVETGHGINRLLWILAFVLGVVFLFNGMFKVVGSDFEVASFEAWHLPLWLMYAVGVFETVCALLLMYKPAVFWVSAALAVEMIAAGVVVVLAGQSWLVVLCIDTLGVLAILGWARRPVALARWIADYRARHPLVWA